jgi:hypothetical protein
MAEENDIPVRQHADKSLRTPANVQVSLLRWDKKNEDLHLPRWASPKWSILDGDALELFSGARR